MVKGDVQITNKAVRKQYKQIIDTTTGCR